MSYNQQRKGPGKPKLCNQGCGTWIHFNPDNPAGRGPNGGWVPLHNVQTPQGIIEVPHNCPAQGAQQGAQAGQPAAPVGPVQQAAPVQQQGAGAPSVTQLLLQVSQEHLAVSKELLAISKEQLSLLKALHPEFGNVPTQEQQSSPEDAPPEYERADTIEEPPK